MTPMLIPIQIPDVVNQEAMNTLKEVSPGAFVVTALALSITTLFIYLYIKEKSAHEKTKDEYLSYAKETVAEQINVSKDVIDLVKHSNGQLGNLSTESRKILDSLSSAVSEISLQLQKIETLIINRR